MPKIALTRLSSQLLRAKELKKAGGRASWELALCEGLRDLRATRWADGFQWLGDPWGAFSLQHYLWFVTCVYESSPFLLQLA